MNHVAQAFRATPNLMNRSIGLESKNNSFEQTLVSDGVPAFAEWLQKIEAPEIAETISSLSLQKTSTKVESDEELAGQAVEIEALLDPLLMADAVLVAEYLDAEALTALLMPVVTQSSADSNQYQLIEADKTKSIYDIKPFTQLHVLPRLDVFQSLVAPEQIESELMTSNEKDQNVESLEKALQMSKGLIEQTSLAKGTDGYQLVTRQVESFLTGEGKETLGLLLKEIKQVVKTVDSPFSSTSTEFETTQELEKLLQHLKGNNQEHPEIDQNLKPVVQHPKSFVTVSQVEEAQLKPVIKDLPKGPEKTTEATTNLSSVTISNRSDETEPLISVERSVPSMQMTSTKGTQQPVDSESLHRSEEQRFVKQLQRIFQQGTMTQLKDGQVQFTLKLFPEHLGKLQIQLIQSGQKLTAQIVAESSATKDLVERSLPQLRQALATNNIPLEHIDVEESMLQDQQQRGDEGSDQHQSKQDEKEDTANSVSFSFKTLLEGLFST